MSNPAQVRFWKISPGRQAILWDEFKAKKYISIGWNDVGDLTQYTNRDEIIKEFYDVFPNSYPDQLLEFFYDMKKGDKVLTYGNKSIYALGEIVGDYYYREEESDVYPYLFYHRRDAKWLEIFDPPLPIEVLPDELQRKLMRPRTIIELTKDEWQSIEEAVKEQPPPEEERPILVAPSFSVRLEKDLRDYLAYDPHVLERGLQLVGKEYQTDVGNIDILFKDTEGHYVVVETKKGQESDKVIGQILRYMGWVKKNLSPNVRGIIVSHSSDWNLEYAVEAIKDMVKLRFYKVRFEISDKPS